MTKFEAISTALIFSLLLAINSHYNRSQHQDKAVIQGEIIYVQTK